VPPLHALLPEGEFRGYSVSVGELEQRRAARQRQFVAHAFRLSDRALEHGIRLPLELVVSDARGWRRGWMDSFGFGLVVVAHEHRPCRDHPPASVLARVRRSASCPVVVVK